MADKLKCGCTPDRLCRQAWFLTLLVESWYNLWRETRDERDWQKYMAAKKRYDAHVQRED